MLLKISRIFHIFALDFLQQKNDVNLLTLGIRQADKYALALLDALFSEEELASSCYATTKRSRKKPLPSERVALLEGIFFYLLNYNRVLLIKIYSSHTGHLHLCTLSYSLFISSYSKTSETRMPWETKLFITLNSP